MTAFEVVIAYLCAHCTDEMVTFSMRDFRKFMAGSKDKSLQDRRAASGDHAGFPFTPRAKVCWLSWRLVLLAVRFGF